MFSVGDFAKFKKTPGRGRALHVEVIARKGIFTQVRDRLGREFSVPTGKLIAR